MSSGEHSASRTFAALIRPVAPLMHRFEDDGAIPNHPDLPLLIYRQAIALEGDDPAANVEAVFAANRWSGHWRDGIYRFPHYHSTAHEVLGIACGEARVRLGGAVGIEAVAGPGDVLVLPAGTGHQNLGASADLLVVGAYPTGQRADLLRGRPDERPQALLNIQRVPLPATDPVYGANGPLLDAWRPQA